MLQFYFLSVLLNIVAGLILVYASDFTKGTSLAASDEQGSDDFDFAGEDTDASETAESASSEGVKIFADGSFMNDSLFRLVVGVLGLLAGLLIIISPIQTDTPVIGDLVPALANILGSVALLLEFYANKLSTEINLPFFLQGIFVTGRRYLGVFCIIAGLMHFIFPRILFL